MNEAIILLEIKNTIRHARIMSLLMILNIVGSISSAYLYSLHKSFINSFSCGISTFCVFYLLVDFLISFHDYRLNKILLQIVRHGKNSYL